MRPVTERQRRRAGTVQPEMGRLAEHRWVAVGGGHHDHDAVAGGNVDLAYALVLGRGRTVDCTGPSSRSNSVTVTWSAVCTSALATGE